MDFPPHIFSFRDHSCFEWAPRPFVKLECVSFSVASERDPGPGSDHGMAVQYFFRWRTPQAMRLTFSSLALMAFLGHVGRLTRGGSR